MQLLARETISPTSPSECSALLIEVAPFIVRRIRNEMRRRTMPGLTISQFKTLKFLRKHPRSSLSQIAAHLGLTPPSTSKLVRKLIEQKAVARKVASDHRRICLSLTERGITLLEQARLETQQQLAENLSSLTQEQLDVIMAALKMLGLAFSAGGDGVDVS